MNLRTLLLFSAALFVFKGREAFGKEDSKDASLSPRAIFKKTASQMSGDIFLLPKKGNFMLEANDFDPKNWYSSTIHGRQLPPHPMTMHGIAQDYDLRIPIVFYSPGEHWFKAGSYKNIAVQQDIAPTLSKILDIPVPAKKGGRVLTESMRSGNNLKPKVIVIFVQDQVGREYYASHPGAAPFYEKLMKDGANYVNASVAHVDVETSVGHASIATGAWPSEHGVTGNNFFHLGIWRQIAALGIQTNSLDSSKQANPSFFFTPSISDVLSVSAKNKPVILSVAPAPRAAISMGGHGALFNGGKQTYVAWLDEVKKDGSWTTEQPNYQLPNSFKEKPVSPWIQKIVDNRRAWRGHELISETGKIHEKTMSASPALVMQQGDLTRAAIEELQIGDDEVTDLVWINTKSTDYCGHLYGYESDECAEVLSAADTESHKIIDLIQAKTNGNFLVVLTADHGAAALPEISGSYRIDKSQLKSDLNQKFDHRDNNIELIQLVTSSQIFVNRGEMLLNNVSMNTMVSYLKTYKGKMEMPFNALADEWVRKGRARSEIFFEDVIAKESLKSN